MKLINKLAIATATTAFAAPMAFAATESNNMTNIVTIVDSCDIVAIGVDFGVRPGAITNDITSLNANTTAGNLITGNDTHPNAGADGGTDDELSITTPVAAVNTLLTTALSAITVAAPGVYVVCTTSPTGLVVDGADGDANLDLTTAGAVAANTGFASKLTPAGGDAAGTIDYTLSFTGVVVEPVAAPGLPGIFTGVYAATGTIPAASNTDVKSAGFYADVATATLTF